jgi:hypothetical protein
VNALVEKLHNRRELAHEEMSIVRDSRVDGGHFNMWFGCFIASWFDPFFEPGGHPPGGRRDWGVAYVLPAMKERVFDSKDGISHGALGMDGSLYGHERDWRPLADVCQTGAFLATPQAVIPKLKRMHDIVADTIC